MPASYVLGIDLLQLPGSRNHLEISLLIPQNGQSNEAVNRSIELFQAFSNVRDSERSQPHIEVR